MAIDFNIIKDKFETDYESKTHTFDFPQVTGQSVELVSHTENNILDENTRTLTDTLIVDTLQHIIDYAETTGSTAEIVYVNSKLRDIVDQTVGALNAIAGVLAGVPGGSAVTAALQPFTQNLNILKIDLQNRIEIMQKNIT